MCEREAKWRARCRMASERPDSAKSRRHRFRLRRRQFNREFDFRPPCFSEFPRILLPATSVMKLLGFLLLLLAAVNAGQNDHMVVKVTPWCTDQVNFLRSLHYSSDLQLDFWTRPTRVSQPVHVMLPVHQWLALIIRLNEHLIPHEVVIANVERELEERFKEMRKRRDASSTGEATNEAQAFNLSMFNTYEDITGYLLSLERSYPDRVAVESIGKTHEQRDIYLVKITPANSSSVTNASSEEAEEKRAVWIDAGIHAREWAAPASILLTIQKLVEGYENATEAFKNLIDSFEWYIVPVLNPDGYVYSMENPDNRLWRKNRSPVVCFNMTESGLFNKTINPSQVEMLKAMHESCCPGVDLNRNFDWHWGEVGGISAMDPCKEYYGGVGPFTEPETRAVRDFLTGHKSKFVVFLSFHSYSQVILYSYNHKVCTDPEDVEDVREAALRAADAMLASSGSVYTFGAGGTHLYPGSGYSVDWAKGVLNIKYSYIIELSPDGGHNWTAFLMPEEDIPVVGGDVWAAVKAFAEAADEFLRKDTPNVSPASTLSTASHATCGWLSVGIGGMCLLR